MDEEMNFLESLEQSDDYHYQQLQEDYLQYLQDIQPKTPKSFNEWIHTETPPPTNDDLPF
jgi:hypothetical protein